MRVKGAKMKIYSLFLMNLFAFNLVHASDLSVDPQREDTYLQREQTHDIQFREDQNLQQEKSETFQIDPH